MKDVLESLYIHTRRYLEYINVNKDELEASALGLQPLSKTEDLSTLERKIIARRYYRLGEWTSVVQGSEWLQVYIALWSIIYSSHVTDANEGSRLHSPHVHVFSGKARCFLVSFDHCTSWGLSRIM